MHASQARAKRALVSRKASRGRKKLVPEWLQPARLPSNLNRTIDELYKAVDDRVRDGTAQVDAIDDFHMDCTHMDCVMVDGTQSMVAGWSTSVPQNFKNETVF
eukprot:543984-Pyramimonas_sp.AAC.2